MPRRRRRTANTEAQGTTLLDLPSELQIAVISSLSVEAKRNLAGTCKDLRALVLQQASGLTLSLGSASNQSMATPELLAAVRRQHGKFALRLRLVSASARRIKGQLSALGPCPAVQLLQISQAADQWTHQASLMAVQNFPNMVAVCSRDCAIRLPLLLPLLQRQPPLYFSLCRSQLCSAAGKYDQEWPLRLLKESTGITGLILDGSYGTEIRARPRVVTPQKFSESLTSLTLDHPGVGSLEEWLNIAKYIPRLQHLSATFDKTVLNRVQDFLAGVPHLVTLCLPNVRIYQAHVLKSLLEHPSLSFLQLDAIHALDEVKPAAPLEMESGALKCLRVTTMCASALAYLPSFALSGLQSCSGRKEILVAICPCLDIPGFTSEEESAELDWATVDTAVAKLGSQLGKLAHMVHLAIVADDLPDEQQPQLAALVTGRVLQLIQRLQPLSNWEGRGIESVSMWRAPLGEEELKALGTALGSSCKRLILNGLVDGPFKDQVEKDLHKYFPLVGQNYQL